MEILTQRQLEQRKECRICLQSDSRPAISPCNCTGSVKYVHQQCLKTWIQKSLEKENSQIKIFSNGYSSMCCEMCRKQIMFKSYLVYSCLSCTELKERIANKKCQWISSFVIVFILGAISGSVAFLVLDNILIGETNGIFIFFMASILIIVGYMFIAMLVKIIKKMLVQKIIQIEFKVGVTGLKPQQEENIQKQIEQKK